MSLPPPQFAESLLVVICSCRNNQAKRAAVRKTWLSTLPSGVRYLFFVGSGQCEVEPDVITLDVGDDYKSLPKKVHELFGHVLENFEFRFLFKCDDDTYVSLERLPDLLRYDVDLVGNETLRKGWPNGGSGYLLSRRAVTLLAQEPAPEKGAEDVWVGRVTQKLNFSTQITPRLQEKCGDFPRECNDQISAHHCVPEFMEVIHVLLHGKTAGLCRRARVFQAKHSKWMGQIELFSNGVFIGGVARPHGRWQLVDGGETLVLSWFHWGSDRLIRTKWGFQSENIALIKTSSRAQLLYEAERSSSPAKRIHFGCGKNRIKGWSNFDFDVDIRKPLPFTDGSVELIFAEHVLEHIKPSEAWSFLKEVRRILSPGGGLRLIVPCVDLICQRYDAQYGRFLQSELKKDDSLESAIGAIICDWGHQAIWTVPALRSVLLALGFETWESRVGSTRFRDAEGIDGHARSIGDHPNWVESGVVEARKPMK